MHRALVFLVFILAFTLVSADVYTEVDYGRMNEHKGVYLGTFPAYSSAAATFDDAGKAQSELTATYFQIPLRLGYSFNNYWTAYMLFPLGRMTSKSTAEAGEEVENVSIFGNGNPWLVGKWIRPTGSGFMMGPRLGFRFPILTKTYEDVPENEIPLGDKNFAIDFAAVGRSHPSHRSFRLDTAIGVRYYTQASYEKDVDYGTVAFDYQPGLFYYVVAEPGFAWGRQKDLGTYAILRYEGQAEGDFTNTAMQPTWYDNNKAATYNFAIGLKQDWNIDERNCLELRFTYDIAGKNSPQWMRFGLGYNGIIPTR